MGTVNRQLKIKTWTQVKLMKHGKLGTTKWVRISTGYAGFKREIEIRDASGWDNGSGWSNSSEKVHHLLNYFSDVLEIQRFSVWDVPPTEHSPPRFPKYNFKTWEVYMAGVNCREKALEALQ